MIATVEDAKKWWCPPARGNTRTHAYPNAITVGMCIADKFSQWRWYCSSTPDEGSRLFGLAGEPRNHAYLDLYF
jgi:hypothetical protein